MYAISSLIHPTGWPQYTNITGRQDRRTDGIGQTVLQTVAQKLIFMKHVALSLYGASVGMSNICGINTTLLSSAHVTVSIIRGFAQYYASITFVISHFTASLD